MTMIRLIVHLLHPLNRLQDISLSPFPSRFSISYAKEKNR